MEDWVKIYSTDKMYKVNIIKAVLAEKDIKCHEINRKDSSYLFGAIDIYVEKENKDAAAEILENHKDL